jgi:hypothetical protein
VCVNNLLNRDRICRAYIQIGLTHIAMLSNLMEPAMCNSGYISKTGRLWCSGLVLLFWSEKNQWFKCKFRIENILSATSGLRQNGPLVLWSSFWSGLVLLALVWLLFGSCWVLWQDQPEPSGFPDVVFQPQSLVNIAHIGKSAMGWSALASMQTLASAGQCWSTLASIGQIAPGHSLILCGLNSQITGQELKVWCGCSAGLSGVPCLELSCLSPATF